MRFELTKIKKFEFEPTNVSFTNDVGAEIFIDWLEAKSRPPRPEGLAIYKFNNRGLIKTNQFDVYQFIHSSRSWWENSGEIETGILTLGGNYPRFTNTTTGILKVAKGLTSSSLNFINQGEIQANQVNLRYGTNAGKIYGDNLVLTVLGSMTNTGEVVASEISAHGEKFLNASGAHLRVRNGVEIDAATFQNDGEMIIERGAFTQKAGVFINKGVWDHTGDIVFGATYLANTGTMNWQKGKWDF